MSANPQYDLSKPFKIVDVTKAAESLLKRDRFDNDRLPSDSEESDSDDSDSSSSDSDSESEDEKSKSKSKKKSKKSHSKSKKKEKRARFRIHESIRSVSSSDSDSNKDTSEKSRSGSSTPSKGSKTPPKDEFEELIEKLGSLSLKDPEYAKVYYKAYQINPIIMKLVPTPTEQRRSQTPPPRARSPVLLLQDRDTVVRPRLRPPSSS